MSENIEVSLEVIEGLRKKLDNLRIATNNKYVKQELKSSIDIIDFNILNFKDSVDEIKRVINVEMKRLKYVDEDLYLKLYILQQDLIKEKISIEKALEFLKNYTSVGEELGNKINKKY